MDEIFEYCDFFFFFFLIFQCFKTSLTGSCSLPVEMLYPVTASVLKW